MGQYSHFAISWQMAKSFAICWQMACSLCHLLADGKEPAAFAICWQTAKYAVSLLTGLTPLRGFAICQQVAKPQALCHQPADGKEAFTGRVSDELFAAKPLPSTDHAFAICHGRWQSARFQ